MDSKQSTLGSDEPWARSVYFAQSLIRCTLQRAWDAIPNYPLWNPYFVGARVSTVRGQPKTEREVVVIQLLGADGTPQPGFHAETIKIVPQHHLVWYVYGDEGTAFRNFLDFQLSETPEGIRFDIACYARDRLAGDSLTNQRVTTQSSLQELAFAFKKYCEQHA